MVESNLPLSRLRARLAQPRGVKRVEALLADDDPQAAVAALPVSELHHLVHEVGFADSMELAVMATPEQIRGCVDLDSWDRDRFDMELAKPWLLAIMDAGHDKVADVWQRLDPELTALIVARACRVYDLSLGDEPADDDKGPIFMTPDRYFALEITTTDDDTARLVHRVIDDLYRADPSGTLARHTLMSARSEPETGLEEMSYRWRSGRMADMGYADFVEALQVFRPIDPKNVRIDEHTEDRFGAPDQEGDPLASDSLPVPVAEQVVGLGFLSRALDRIQEADEVARLEMAMVVLTNKVLAAARVSPGNLEAVPLAAEHALSTLSLGLESVSQGDLASAERALRTISLTRLHRLGYTVTLRLALVARQLSKRATTAAAPVDGILAALTGRRPFFPEVLDNPPGASVRPFASLADVRAVALMLTKLAVRVATADALGADLLALAGAPEPRPELDDFVRTALVRVMLGGALEARPLTLAEIGEFQRKKIREGRIEAAAREASAAALASHLEAHDVESAGAFLPELVSGWMADIENALADLPVTPDRRYIDRVLVARERS